MVKREFYERYGQAATLTDDPDVRALVEWLRDDKARHQDEIITIPMARLDAHVHESNHIADGPHPAAHPRPCTAFLCRTMTAAPIFVCVSPDAHHTLVASVCSALHMLCFILDIHHVTF